MLLSEHKEYKYRKLCHCRQQSLGVGPIIERYVSLPRMLKYYTQDIHV